MSRTAQSKLHSHTTKKMKKMKLNQSMKPSALSHLSRTSLRLSAEEGLEPKEHMALDVPLHRCQRLRPAAGHAVGEPPDDAPGPHKGPAG